MKRPACDCPPGLTAGECPLGDGPECGCPCGHTRRRRWGTRSSRVWVLLPPRVLELVDLARGSQSRSAWILERVRAGLAQDSGK